MFLVDFVGRRDGDGHLFFGVFFPPHPPPLQHVRELPEFAYLMSLDRSKLATVLFSGMVGCLVLPVCLVINPGLSLLVS